MRCRHCESTLVQKVLDLGSAPPSNAYLTAKNLRAPETGYPLVIRVCHACWLVQTDAARYCQGITARLGLNSASRVIEVASNDGYLLRNFVAAGIPCLGIEPTDSTAEAAEAIGIPVLREFFTESLGRRLASGGQQADLIIGNNVFAHVPAINDFTLGLKATLKPTGTITLEFPHLMRMFEQNQFDTVYHEHFSYFTLHTVQRIFAAAGLRVWDVDELPTHGGSIRVYGCHVEDPRPEAPAVAALVAEEVRRGLQSPAGYEGFQAKANRIKDDLLFFLIQQKRAGKTVAAYGAAAKGNTLLNYAGVKPDLLPFVCDAAPSKQGKWMPGSHIPILPPSILAERRPDYLLILPWNIAAEVRQQNSALERLGTRFVTAIPELTVFAPAA
ncbi:MAG: class I SAM-dependent methyltransferase [Proteobacteria bacterium]|nr:class I SAM-dependent methyltransferase [Pseudomonadota bacterium]